MSRRASGLRRPGPGGLRLRPQADADHAFLLALYEDLRWPELASTGWPEVAKRAFLADQHRLREFHYRTQFPNAAYDIVMVGNHAIGRLCVDRRVDEARIVDIALLSVERGAGVGGRLITGVIDEAARDGLAVSLSVAIDNPRALALYHRLGFLPTPSSQGIYQTLRRAPQAQVEGATQSPSSHGAPSRSARTSDGPCEESAIKKDQSIGDAHR